MRLVADESVEAFIVNALRAAGRQVYDIADTTPGIKDTDVLGLAFERGEVLLTDDKDFGELAFLHNQPHRGVILMRLHGTRPRDKSSRVVMLFGLHAHESRTLLQPFVNARSVSERGCDTKALLELWILEPESIFQRSGLNELRADVVNRITVAPKHTSAYNVFYTIAP